jgi:hypothetical protein
MTIHIYKKDREEGRFDRRAKTEMVKVWLGDAYGKKKAIVIIDNGDGTLNLSLNEGTAKESAKLTLNPSSTGKDHPSIHIH